MFNEIINKKIQDEISKKLNDFNSNKLIKKMINEQMKS